MISGLDFKINPSASYITDRKSVTFFTSGSQNYISGQGARVIRLQINSDGWLDPSTARLHYTLTNTCSTVTNGAGVVISAPYLRPIGGPWSMFSRIRVMYQGALVEDINA